MYTVDIHSNKETKEIAKSELDIAISFARKDKDKLLKVIVGYGSKSNKHIIKTYILEYLLELKDKSQIKDYIEGENLDIFNPKYMNFKYGYRIPDFEKRTKNPGVIYIIL
jgi:hypothetical protein